MAVQNPKKAPVSGIGVLGVGICSDSRHVGIIYRRGSGTPRLWHLAMHYDLRDEPCDKTYFWANCALDEHNKNYVAAWITARSVRADKIPFGFDATGAAFDAKTGEFIAPPVGKGLTCATFITAVFQHLGFDLLDEKT